jgi:hypothetical protein
LLTSKDQALLIRGNTFLVLDLLLDSLDSVGRFDIERNGFTCEEKKRGEEKKKRRGEKRKGKRTEDKKASVLLMKQKNGKKGKKTKDTMRERKKARTREGLDEDLHRHVAWSEGEKKDLRKGEREEKRRRMRMRRKEKTKERKRKKHQKNRRSRNGIQ